MNSFLKKMGHIHYAVSKEDIDANDISHIASFFERLEKNVGVCKSTQGKLSLSFTGYEEDPRELWQVDAVRAWFAAAFERVKYWFYFLDPKYPGRTLDLIYVLLCDPEWKVQGSEISLDLKLIATVTEKCFQWLNELTDRMGMPMEENERISLSVMEGIQALPKFGDSSGSKRPGLNRRARRKKKYRQG